MQTAGQETGADQEMHFCHYTGQQGKHFHVSETVWIARFRQSRDFIRKSKVFIRYIVSYHINVEDAGCEASKPSPL